MGLYELNFKGDENLAKIFTQQPTKILYETYVFNEGIEDDWDTGICYCGAFMKDVELTNCKISYLYRTSFDLKQLNLLVYFQVVFFSLKPRSLDEDLFANDINTNKYFVVPIKNRKISFKILKDFESFYSKKYCRNWIEGNEVINEVVCMCNYHQNTPLKINNSDNRLDRTGYYRIQQKEKLLFTNKNDIKSDYTIQQKESEKLLFRNPFEANETLSDNYHLKEQKEIGTPFITSEIELRKMKSKNNYSIQQTEKVELLMSNDFKTSKTSPDNYHLKEQEGIEKLLITSGIELQKNKLKNNYLIQQNEAKKIETGRGVEKSEDCANDLFYITRNESEKKIMRSGFETDKGFLDGYCLKQQEEENGKKLMTSGFEFNTTLFENYYLKQWEEENMKKIMTSGYNDNAHMDNYYFEQREEESRKKLMTSGYNDNAHMDNYYFEQREEENRKKIMTSGFEFNTARLENYYLKQQQEENRKKLMTNEIQKRDTEVSFLIKQLHDKSKGFVDERKRNEILFDNHYIIEQSKRQQIDFTSKNLWIEDDNQLDLEEPIASAKDSKKIKFECDKLIQRYLLFRYYFQVFEKSILADEFLIQFNIKISIQAALSCLSKGVIVLGHADFKRNEFLGDAVLYCAVMLNVFCDSNYQLMIKMPQVHKIISNKNLIEVMKKTGILEFTNKVSRPYPIFNPGNLSLMTDCVEEYQNQLPLISFFKTRKFFENKCADHDEYQGTCKYVIDNNIKQPKIYADIFESLIGQIYKVSGLKGATNFMIKTGLFNELNFVVPHFVLYNLITKKEKKMIEKKLNFTFKNKALLEAAVIHPSFDNENKTGRNFKFLVHLGHSILTLVITDYLFDIVGGYKSNEMFKFRKNILKNHVLYSIFEELDLVRHFKFIQNCNEDGGSDSATINSSDCKMVNDIIKAIFGAVFVDCEFKMEIMSLFFNQLASSFLDYLYFE